ncbi:MAG: Trk system potassium transporter TrkA [Spirochaetes bacterium]|nr:Trk system potassium transporter TrkA [Spirochaetota bacterium]
MNIVIAGGGNIGVTVAKKMIFEDHNVTVIEKDENLVKILRNELDALIIQGDAVDISILKQANISRSEMFLALTNNDNTNIVSSMIAYRLNPNQILVAKIEKTELYFSDPSLKPEDLGLAKLVDPKNLSMNKIITLIEHPEATEFINYAHRQTQLVGIRINHNFPFKNLSLSEMSQKDQLFQKLRIVAIYRNEKIIIPKGNDILRPMDKVYFIGKNETINTALKTHFYTGIKLKKIIIIGGNKETIELTQALMSSRYEITIVEENLEKCNILAKELKDIIIINGKGTDPITIKELDIDESCVVSLTNDDEYNVITAVTAKKHGALKTICKIKNVALTSVINSIPLIDAVYSPHILTVGEVVRFCRKDNIISVTSFSEIEAEMIDLIVTEKIPILDKPLKDVRFPEGIIIGVLVRDDQVIIPTGENRIKLNDKLLIFVLPDALPSVEKIFSKKLLRIRK